MQKNGIVTWFNLVTDIYGAITTYHTQFQMLYQ